MQRLYPANSGSNNGMHNRSIFTITPNAFHLSQHLSLFLSFRLMQMSKQTVQFYTYGFLQRNVENTFIFNN